MKSGPERGHLGRGWAGAWQLSWGTSRFPLRRMQTPGRPSVSVPMSLPPFLSGEAPATQGPQVRKRSPGSQALQYLQEQYPEPLL